MMFSFQSIFRLKRFAFQTLRPGVSRKNAVFPRGFGRAALCCRSGQKRLHRPLPSATRRKIRRAGTTRKQWQGGRRALGKSVALCAHVRPDGHHAGTGLRAGDARVARSGAGGGHAGRLRRGPGHRSAHGAGHARHIRGHRPFPPAVQPAGIRRRRVPLLDGLPVVARRIHGGAGGLALRGGAPGRNVRHVPAPELRAGLPHQCAQPQGHRLLF